MILEQLVKRSGRERRTIAAAVVALGLVACYTAGIGPALRSLEGYRNDFDTTQSGLALQQRQLALLKAETAACMKTIEQLKDAPCPWLPAGQADAFLQNLQDTASDLGLTVRSLVRERATSLKLKDAASPVTVLLVRLELAGPYPAIVELLRKLSRGTVAVGLEELSVKGLDDPPYDVEVILTARFPIVEGVSNVPASPRT